MLGVGVGGSCWMRRTRLYTNKRGEGTADWDTAASNCSTGNRLSNVKKRISSKNSNREIRARWGFPTVSSPLLNNPGGTRKRSGCFACTLGDIERSGKTHLRRRRTLRHLAWKTPNQGLESRLCCWTAGSRLAQKEWFVSQTPVFMETGWSP